VTALALFEARKVARNPLLWAGFALLLAFVVLNMNGYWSSVPEDAGYAHEGLVALVPFALLAGAWVGLRDGTTGATRVIESTPLKGRGLLVPARMAALSAVALIACSLVFAATSIVSFARGGRGSPDLFLVLDSGLYVALAACIGFAIGHLTGSRILSLLAAPLLPAFVFYLQGTESGSLTQPSWLLPSPRLPGRFGPLGYLPDIFPVHVAYLVGALLALTGFVWVVVARRDGTRARLGVVALATGAAVFLVSAGWLVTQPYEVHVYGSDPSRWVEIHSPRDYDLLPRGRDGAIVPDERLANECAESGGITACVFPEWGPRLAQSIADDAAPLAAFASLEGIPQTVVMVPTAEHTGIDHCTLDGRLLVGSRRWSTEFETYESLSEAAFYCAVYGRRQLVNPAADALHAWFEAGVSRGLRGEEFVRAVRQGWGRRAAATVGHLADVPVAEVVARLEPVWDDVRARRTTVDELREALGA
jgi:hypothetical protein